MPDLRGPLDRRLRRRSRPRRRPRSARRLAAAGYPASADPARINWPVLVGVLLLFVVAATALYGPQAAALVEMFPTRIRYTAMSLPYHVGTGWVGGFLPVTSFAIVAITGDIYAGLWYAVVFTAMSVGDDDLVPQGNPPASRSTERSSRNRRSSVRRNSRLHPRYKCSITTNVAWRYAC